MTSMANHDSEFRVLHTRHSGTARALVVCGLVFVTAIVGGRFVRAQGRAAPEGYAQRELRRASRDNPAEIRSRSYATDELGRAIVKNQRSVPLHHTSNGQPIAHAGSVEVDYYIGFDGRPIDDPFRLGTSQSPLSVTGNAVAGGAETIYHGSNGQPIEFESAGVGVYGSNGALIDPTSPNGASLNGAPSSLQRLNSPAAAGADPASMGGNGLFRRDRVKRRGGGVVDTTADRDEPSEFVWRRPLHSLVEGYDAEADGEPILSPLLPLMSYDEDGSWIESYDVAGRERNDRSRNVPASYEPTAAERPAFGMPRHVVTGQPPRRGAMSFRGATRFPGATGFRGATMLDAATSADAPDAAARDYRWPGHSPRKPVKRSGGKPASRS
jgi:hypothetical protein